MAWAVLLIGIVVAADALLGYQLAMGRARRQGTRNALAEFEVGAFREAFRHWALSTALCMVFGAVIGAREGPGALHGIMTVAAASFGLALPVTYLAGIHYARRARQLIQQD